MWGTLTFLTNADANTFWAKLQTIVVSNQVIYAKFDLTQNAHHWSDNRVPPDIITDQIILGDVNAIPAGII